MFSRRERERRSKVVESSSKTNDAGKRDGERQRMSCNLMKASLLPCHLTFRPQAMTKAYTEINAEAASTQTHRDTKHIHMLQTCARTHLMINFTGTFSLSPKGGGPHNRFMCTQHKLYKYTLTPKIASL